MIVRWAVQPQESDPNGADLSEGGMGVSPVEDRKSFDHGRDAHATMVKAMPKPLKSAPFESDPCFSFLFWR